MTYIPANNPQENIKRRARRARDPFAYHISRLVESYRRYGWTSDTVPAHWTPQERAAVCEWLVAHPRLKKHRS